MTFLIVLLVLAAVLVQQTVRLVRADGRGLSCPPASHAADRQFLPPALR